MKASELMIGDWVNLSKGNWSENRQVELTDIEMIAESVYLADPIPLTPEILEKNGWKHEFDKEDYMVKYDLAVEGKNCWMMWAVKEHNLDIQRQDEKLDMYNLKVQRVCMPCDYIHELQRALHLCGIEKDIEL